MNDRPPRSHPRDPLHGNTRETVVAELLERHWWAEMRRRIPVCSSRQNISLDLVDLRAQYTKRRFCFADCLIPRAS
ncbi:MAG: VF530 family DNA-binding protein [Nitrospirae bacterium]|nr:VF530 family DNA-binding protein [Nitrospirota bacterium]MDE3042301.1 VF530 family DNA-binding protein [Nitrospirota bacterium]